MGVVGILLFSCAHLNAQTFSIQSGNWNSPSTWSSGIVPDVSSGSIIINHKINISPGISLTVDELMLNDTLLIESGATIILNNAIRAGADLQILTGGLKIYGRLICRDSATFSGTTLTNTFFYDGSTYEHQYFNTAGTPPIAWWSANSNLEITGYTKPKTLNNVLWSQSFGNVIYNCPGQQSFIEFVGRLKTIKGNLLIINTNGKVLRLSLDAVTSTTITIGGNLIVSGKSSVWFSRAATTSVFIGGDFRILSNATASTYLTTTGNCNVNVEGDFELNSTSILRFASGTLTGIGTLRVNKNFLFSNGTLTVSTGTGVGTIEMKGSSSQSLSSLGLWTSGVKLYVSNAHGVIVQDHSKVEGDVVVSSGAQLIFPATNFTVHGNLTIQSGGSIRSNNGTLSLGGSGNQSIALAGDTLHHLNINKPSGTSVAFSDASNLSGVLSVVSATTTVFSNGNLTLLSSSDDGNDDASIYTIPSGSSLSGDLTVQRYMSGEGSIYRYISSPISNATVASLMDDFPITGTFTNPSTGPGILATIPSFYYYDETLSTDLGWTPYPLTGLAKDNLLSPGRGYAAYVNEASNSTTWDVTGPINQGDIAFLITFVNTSDPTNDGWNLVGNPYPSSIDWNAVGGWDKVHVDNGIAVRDNGIDNFLYWDGEVGSLGSGRIAKGQSFWIKTNDVNPQLRIKETAKTNALTSFYRTKTSEPDYLEVTIQSSQHIDKTYLRLRDHSRVGFDSMDVVKFPNDFMNLSFETNNISLAISAMDQLDCTQAYPLTLSFTKMSAESFAQSPFGIYQLGVHAHGLFANNGITLYDHFTNTSFNLTTTDYSFSISEDSASYTRNRFSLFFVSPSLHDNLSILADSILCDTSPLYKIELQNTQNNTQYKLFSNEKEMASSTSKIMDSLLIELETKDLNNGFLTFKIKARNLCNIKEIKNIFVWKQKTHAPNLLASTACNSDTTTLIIKDAIDANAFNWYDYKKSFLFQTRDSSLQVYIQKSTTFFASSVFNHGCISQQASTYANVLWFDMPTITEYEGLLHSNYSSNIKWSLEGEDISGADLSTLEPTTTGNYTVTVTHDDCHESAFHYFIYQDGSCKVFPNPAEQFVQVIAPKGEQIIRLEIMNSSGQSVKIFLAEPYSKSETLAVGDLAPGIYSINVFTTKILYKIRFLKK